jgi:hypothetical protein
MACLLPFGRVLPFARDGAILTGRRKDKKWVYIAAGLMGGGKIEGVRGVVQAGRAGGGVACIPSPEPLKSSLTGLILVSLFTLC